MDASRTDVESCAPHRDARGCKVTLLVALQNVLLIGSLLIALYFFWTNNQPEFIEDVHIQFSPIADIPGGTTLKFEHILHSYRMNLTDGSHITTECRGPYVVHMDVCYKSTQGQASGTLVLQGGSKELLGSFELLAHKTQEVCRGLQSIVYLREKEKATLRLNPIAHFKIINVTVGLNYLLGSRCEF